MTIIAALALTGCAPAQPHERVQPPAPRHPIIEGNFKSVSATDIRRVLEVMRKHITEDNGCLLPIYSLYVVDRNHISVCYWAKGLETWAYVERVKGKWWKLSESAIERVITTGVNIPTG